MGWHCITVWECELKPSKREETLESIAFTLNHIWLQDHQARVTAYPQLNEEDQQMPMAAEGGQWQQKEMSFDRMFVAIVRNNSKNFEFVGQLR